MALLSDLGFSNHRKCHQTATISCYSLAVNHVDWECLLLRRTNGQSLFMTWERRLGTGGDNYLPTMSNTSGAQSHPALNKQTASDWASHDKHFLGCLYGILWQTANVGMFVALTCECQQDHQYLWRGGQICSNMGQCNLHHAILLTC